MTAAADGIGSTAHLLMPPLDLPMYEQVVQDGQMTTCDPARACICNLRNLAVTGTVGSHQD